MDASQHGARRARLAATAAAVVLGVSGAAAVAVGVSKQDPAPPAPPTVSTPEPSRGGPAASDDPSGGPAAGSGGSPSAERRAARLSSLDFSEPATISIPSIGVESRLVDLGLDPRGVMETPVPVDLAGWFTPSPPPGVGGSTVIAGHVTWDQQPTVFYRLGELRRGDRVSVTRDDGATVVYEVTRIGSFAKEEFPTEQVYGQPGRTELRLITCGGEYDAAAGRYLDNVIVWARAVDLVRA